MSNSKKVKIEFDQVTLWKAGTIIFAVLFIISIFTGGFSGSSSGSADGKVVVPPTQDPGQQPLIKADVSIKGEPCFGDKNAEVLVVEFTDYQCPFCQRAYQNTYPEIKKLVDKGDVRFCVKDYPLPFHEQADEASIAANCAGEQDKYEEMHDKLFETMETWSGNADIKPVFVGYAKDLGLDEDDFSKCFDDPAQRKEVEGDVSEGSGAGVSGTPSFLINGQLLVGAQPWSAFKTVIDAELSK
jgi:protein-disulfide isomerase|tara:strand:+ start:1331 stop:2056 length:726 start_codon:yes stop_codon:yes gene_type:complete